MRWWKPLTLFLKHRDESAWHADFALEPGDSMTMILRTSSISKPTIKKQLAYCTKGQTIKIHMEVCMEPFRTR